MSEAGLRNAACSNAALDNVVRALRSRMRRAELARLLLAPEPNAAHKLRSTDGIDSRIRYRSGRCADDASLSLSLPGPASGCSASIPSDAGVVRSIAKNGAPGVWLRRCAR